MHANFDRPDYTSKTFLERLGRQLKTNVSFLTGAISSLLTCKRAFFNRAETISSHGIQLHLIVAL